MWEYLVTEFTEFTKIYGIVLIIFSASGITYVVFLWFSFLLIGIKKLKNPLRVMVEEILE